jgi:hypothetical protein
MSAEATFRRLAAEIDIQRGRVSKATPARLAVERATLDFEELCGACALAGVRLDRSELAALAERGFATGGRPFREYALAAGCAAAARLVSTAQPVRAGRLVRLGEIVELHALATRYDDAAQPGAWRVTTAAPLRSGIVPPPFWLVPREMAAFARRFGARPPAGEDQILFVAKAHEAFTRIHPFAAGNGRVARLLASLMLRRSGLPGPIIAPSQAARYRAALVRADSGDIWPLALLMARAVSASLSRLECAAGSGDLRPLAAFAAGAEREALYKAIQRDRLRAVRRGRALFTTSRWIDAYRRSTGAAAPD